MSSACSACATPVTASWRFCPHCGAAIAPVTPTHPDKEPVPVRNAYTGLMWGLIVAPIMVIFGALLCLTGLGAILGIPLIIGGVLAPLAGPMIGISEAKGACPWCGAAVASFVKRPGFFCHACSRRIAIHDGKFVREDSFAAAREDPVAATR